MQDKEARQVTATELSTNLDDFIRRIGEITRSHWDGAVQDVFNQAILDLAVYGLSSVRVEHSSEGSSLAVQSPLVSIDEASMINFPLPTADILREPYRQEPEMSAQGVLDLSHFNLVPFKTKGKTRDGRIARYIGQVTYTASMSYMWMIHAQDGHFYTTTGGRYSTNEENEHDIVQIATPWVPSEGSFVTAYGYANDDTTPHNGEMRFVVVDRFDDEDYSEDEDPGEDFICVEEYPVDTNRHGSRLFFHKRQIARWRG